MHNSKSQTATEYIVILAVVIVIALIVVGVMGGIPSIGGGLSEQAAKVNLAQAQIGIRNYAVDDTGTSLRLVNNLAGTVRVNSINIGHERCQLCNGTFTLKAGETKLFNCPNMQKWTPGERFELPVVIDYTELNTDAKYIQSSEELQLVGRTGNTRTSLSNSKTNVEPVEGWVTDVAADYCGNVYTYIPSTSYYFTRYNNGVKDWELLYTGVHGIDFNSLSNPLIFGSAAFGGGCFLGKYSLSGNLIKNLTASGCSSLAYGWLCSKSINRSPYTKQDALRGDKVEVVAPPCKKTLQRLKKLSI